MEKLKNKSSVLYNLIENRKHFSKKHNSGFIKYIVNHYKHFNESEMHVMNLLYILIPIIKGILMISHCNLQ